MTLILGIDTSNKDTSCFVFGSFFEVDKLYKNIEKEISKKCDWKLPIHWRKMTSSTRYCISKSVLPYLEETRLKFFIFKHKKPRNITYKEHLLKILPINFAYHFEKLLGNTFGNLNIECDKDYEVKGKRKCTTITFLKTFLNSISQRLTTKPADIKEAKNGYLYTDIYHKNECLRINAGIKKSDYSNAIQIADLVLGLYNYNKKELNEKNIINFSKIK